MSNRFFSLEEIIAGIEDKEKATKVVFFENERMNGVVWYVPSGQEVPPHYHPKTDDIWIVLQGEGDYFLGDGKTAPIKQGLFAMAEMGQVHGAKSTGSEPLIFVAMTTPMPIEMVKVDN